MNYALLVTDIVDSTRLSEQLGDEAAAKVWAAHDRVARDLLRPHHGREIDKTDGFLLLFERAADAHAYAVAYHRAIGALDPPLRARAGLHVGPVILTENAPDDVARGAKPLEVDGLAKPTAARIMSVAAGGQTLVSEQARAALADGALDLASHGHWRMKGVAEPMELFEVRSAEAPMRPPPDGAKVWRVIQRDGAWLPVREVRHSLPAERDRFVGRDADLRSLSDLLERSRLVSVLGIGGTGKTRLVTRFAWTWLGDFPGGAWFCDLSEARAVDGICTAVATTLDVPLGKGDPVAQLGHALAGRGECLVVLDNFEQVARYAQETLGRWLDRAPQARFVVTTREVLGLPGEGTLPLAPLEGADAFDLFLARARQAKPDFAPDDVASIRSLVRLLDGLPLAIELAAARVRMMPPKMLLERMSQRFKLLSSTGARHTRQATLRGAFDWSWDLLSADEQSALAQLSVFEGGFTLEAAEGVLSLADLWPMDAVQALVDRSWVRPVSDDRSDAVRMDLLVSVQEYAAEKLEAAGARAETEARHVAWFARMGTEEALAELRQGDGASRRRALAREIDNLVAACRRAADSGSEHAAALLRAAWSVLELQGPAARGLELAERVSAVPGLSLRSRARAASTLGRALHLLGRVQEARAQYEATLAIARSDPTRSLRHIEGRMLNSLGSLAREAGRIAEARAWLDAALALAREEVPPKGRDRRLEAQVLAQLGIVATLEQRREDARALLEESLAIARALGDHRSEATALGNLAPLARERGMVDEAYASFRTALEVGRRFGDRTIEATMLGNLATLDRELGRAEVANAGFASAYATFRDLGNRRAQSYMLSGLGNTCLDLGRIREAKAHLEASLAIARELGDPRLEGGTLGNLGSLAAKHGDPDTAQACFEEALKVQRAAGNKRHECDALANLGLLLATRERYDEARPILEEALALACTLGDRRAETYIRDDLGELCRVQGRLHEARVHLEGAVAIARGARYLHFEGAALMHLGQLEADEGHLDRARAHLAASDRIFRESTAPHQLFGTLAARAEVEARAGDTAAAHAALDEARAIVLRLGSTPAMERAIAAALAKIQAR